MRAFDPGRVDHAIILAAGMGKRMGGVFGDRPKGLIAIDGEPLVGRSVRLLRAAGIRRITIVVGHHADQYARFAVGQADIELTSNDEFEATGSMASLAVALDRVHCDVLVLESDIVYEARALSTLLGSASRDATLISGPTGAGDEVWVYAPDGRLHAMSKVVHELPGVAGEFVGVTRLSATTANAMLHAFKGFVDRHGHGRMDYETDALVAVGRMYPISCMLIPDLRWGEIDDERQFERVATTVWPVVGDRQPPVVT